ncbi:MAG TPA: hypothetical protein VKP14_10700 [Gaiellaceae bacterium]|nr:hypothetical protein [Gaiellaceae bacterium]
MTLHRIEDDLRNHAWYEALFVQMIADVEAFAARWAAFEQIVEATPLPGTGSDSPSAARTSL